MHSFDVGTMGEGRGPGEVLCVVHPSAADDSAAHAQVTIELVRPTVVVYPYLVMELTGKTTVWKQAEYRE
jgi:hypothetical protein